MRLPHLALVILIAPLFALPVASATGQCIGLPTTYACAGDYGAYNGCENEGEFSSENTGVMASTPAGYVTAGGYHSCSNFCFPFFGCFRSEGRGVHAVASVIVVGYAGADWSGAYGQCHTTVFAFGAAGYQYKDLGCPVGPPPAQPWGHVLP